MPVRKFRCVEEMTDPLSYRPGDPDNIRAAVALSDMCFRLAPVQPPPGVHKYRSALEAWEARENWERQSAAVGLRR